MKNRCFVEFADRLKSALDAKQPLVVQLHRKPAQLRTAKGRLLSNVIRSARLSVPPRSPIGASKRLHPTRAAESLHVRGNP